MEFYINVSTPKPCSVEFTMHSACNLHWLCWEALSRSKDINGNLKHNSLMTESSSREGEQLKETEVIRAFGTPQLSSNGGQPPKSVVDQV